MSDSGLPVLCLLGPTASGKTGLAVELRQRYPIDIVSVDSALVYKRMDIGTAKPDAQTLSDAPHALIDLIEPWESYSVSRFVDDANAEIRKSHSAGRIPVLAGGTMLYFDALWNGLSKLPPSTPEVRKKLQEQMAEFGVPAMHDRLAQVDEASAARLNPQDPQRVLRALEVYELTGIPLSQQQNRQPPESHFDFLSIGLWPPERSILHTRIEQRFHEMLSLGFEQEVTTLRQDQRMHVNLPAMRCVGYRQMWAYLDGEYSFDEMVNRGVAATRQLAKRQLTWMRKMQKLELFDIGLEAEQLVSMRPFVEWAAAHRI